MHFLLLYSKYLNESPCGIEISGRKLDWSPAFSILGRPNRDIGGRGQKFQGMVQVGEGQVFKGGGAAIGTGLHDF